MPLGMSKNSFFVNQVGKKLAFQRSSSFPFAEQGNEEVYYTLDSEDNLLRVHHFKSTSDTGLTFTTGGEIYVALVGGGGGGGHAGIGSAGNYSNSFVWAGGGGAGGVVETTYTVSSNSSISFQIGTGGSAGVDGYRGSTGGDTTFNGLTAFGGGGGGGGRSNNFSGNDGGCGGGAATKGCCVLSVSGSQNGGSGVSGQGYGGGLATGNNGSGGGGGGAGASGNVNNEAVTSNRGRGGIGKLVFGVYLGGGGGAGKEGGSIGQDGGAGGGGAGAASRTPGGNATSGVNGYGGGGGGGSFYNSGNGFVPGNGGNGGVLVAYRTSEDNLDIVTDDLVLYLDASNENSYPETGTTWFDLSPSENDGTLVGSPAYNPYGALFFRGTASSQYVTIPHDATSMDFSNQQTICMWMLPLTDEVESRRNPYNQAYGGPGTLTHETNGTINYYFGTNGGNGSPYVNRNSGFTVADNELAFITVTRNQTTNSVKWYKNGSLVTSSNAAGYASTANGTNPILIGDGYMSGFLGNIYFCAVYNRELSAIEVYQNYIFGKKRYEKNLTGWANFGEGLQSEGLNSYSFGTTVDYTSSEGGSLVFNGTTDSHIDFSASVGSTTTSVEMWVKLDSDYSSRMFFGWNTYDVYCGSGNLGFNTANGDIYGISSATVASLGLTGNWKHYVFEMRSDVSYTNNKIYINGVSQTLSQQTGTENAANRTFNSGDGRIAGWLYNNSYRMKMNCAVFKVYNRALTQEEIDTKYNEFSSRFS